MKRINLNTCSYPYYHLAFNVNETKNNLDKLKKYPFNVKINNNNLFIDLSNYKKIEKFLRLADYFSEEIRIKCRFKDYDTPYDWFQKNRNNIIKHLQKNKELCFSYITIDDYIWSDSKFKECSNFPIPVAYILIKHFKVRKWLDPSAGWGDRLTAAIAWGCEYQGTDPNLAMQSKYNEIIENYSKDDAKEKYKILPVPFEKFEVPSQYYDLVFTSPPFFKLEKYASDASQCNIAHPTLSKWLNNFLYPMIKKAEKTLVKKDG